MEEKLLVIYYL